MENEYFKYLTVGEEDKNWGFYINVAGFSHFPSNLDYPPESHPSGYFFTWERGRILSEFQLNYITEGSGILETRTGKYHLQPGSVFMLFPGEWHRYRPDKRTGWREHYLGFDGDYAKRLVSLSLFRIEQPVLHLGFQDKVLQAFYRLIDEVKEEKSGYQQVAAGICIEFLASILSSIKNREFEGKDIERKIRKARIFFRDNLEQPIDVEKLAYDLNIGYSYFRKMFKKFTGISPVQYHLLLRLQKARELLVSTDKSIKEIAVQLGFQSIFYFTRIFKKKMGIPPSELRKNH